MTVVGTQLDAVRPKASVLLVAAFVGLGVSLVLGIAGPFLTFLDPSTQSLLEARQPPSSAHLLGTDELGRDILARVIYGAHLSLSGPLVAASCAMLVAIPLALWVASRGGVVETIIMRLADTVMAFPALLIIIVIVGLFGGSYWLAVGVLVLLIVPSDLRLIRSAAVGQQALPYLEAARLVGASRPRIMFVHVLPNLVPTVVATFLLEFVGALIALSALAFLGLGAPPGSADWGSMLAANLRVIDLNPWASLAPAILLITTAFSVTTVGDWVYAKLNGDGRG